MTSILWVLVALVFVALARTRRRSRIAGPETQAGSTSAVLSTEFFRELGAANPDKQAHFYHLLATMSGLDRRAREKLRSLARRLRHIAVERARARRRFTAPTQPPRRRRLLLRRRGSGSSRRRLRISRRQRAGSRADSGDDAPPPSRRARQDQCGALTSYHRVRRRSPRCLTSTWDAPGADSESTTGFDAARSDYACKARSPLGLDARPSTLLVRASSGRPVVGSRGRGGERAKRARGRLRRPLFGGAGAEPSQALRVPAKRGAAGSRSRAR